jgi:hypothetical protein
MRILSPINATRKAMEEGRGSTKQVTVAVIKNEVRVAALKGRFSSSQ